MSATSEPCPLWKWIISAYIAVGSIQSCVLFLENERKTNKKQKMTAKKKKTPTVYRFVTAKNLMIKTSFLVKRKKRNVTIVCTLLTCFL